MHVKYANRASHKTKKAIETAFTTLLIEKKQIEKVTVAAIVKLCDIDRTTFYTYFRDIYEVAEEIENQAISNLFESEDTPVCDSDQFFTHVFSYLRQNLAKYQQLLQCDEPMRFMGTLQKKMSEQFIISQGLQNEQQSCAAMEMLSYGIIQMIIAYAQGNSRYTLDELETYCKNWVRLLLAED